MAQIIASHVVKPSSPTPNTLNKHYLSTIDQLAPPVYLTLLFFYENNHESEQHEEISRRLKQSLSEILTVFYPLAGRMNGNSFVNCDDSGAKLMEARVDGRLSQYTQNPKMEELEQLLPAGFSSHFDNPILSVRATYFDCGGVAVGVCWPHKLGDTSCFATFMSAWAATCRGEASGIVRPTFDLALRFPPRESLAHGVRLGLSGEKMVTRRLVFERDEVEKLKKEASRNSAVKDPSRVEAVSSFLWRSFINAHKEVDKETTPFPTSHMVSMRRRAVPPVPDHAFGNCFTLALALVSKEEEEETEEDDGVLVSRLRNAIRGVDDDYINALNDDGFVQELFCQIGDFLKPGNCIFTSWLRFPLYEVDFGWGKPVRVCTATMPYMNLVVLMDTPSGDGIEAWVNVPGDDFFALLQASCNKNLDRLVSS